MARHNLITLVLLIALFATIVLAVDTHKSSNKQATENVLQPKEFASTLEKAHAKHKVQASKHAPEPKESAAAAKADATVHDKANAADIAAKTAKGETVSTTKKNTPPSSAVKSDDKKKTTTDKNVKADPKKKTASHTSSTSTSKASSTSKAQSPKHTAIKNTRKTLKIRDDLPDYAKAAKLKLNSFIESGKTWPGQPDVMGCTPLECQEWCDECDGSITCQSKCFNNLYCRDECAVLLS